MTDIIFNKQLLRNRNVLGGGRSLEEKFLLHYSEMNGKGPAAFVQKSLTSRDLPMLKYFAMNNSGDMTNALRKEVWYTLLNAQLPSTKMNDADSIKPKKHKDEDQVVLDVNRSFGALKNLSQKERLRALLQKMIIKILRKYPQLNYYQGYHDVVSVFVLVFFERLNKNPTFHSIKREECNLLNETMDTDNDVIEPGIANAAETCGDAIDEKDTKFVLDETKLFRCIESFTLLYLRDFMTDSLDFAVDQLKMIPYLIKKMDPELYQILHLDKIEPFFALSDILTIFSHNQKPYEDIGSTEPVSYTHLDVYKRQIYTVE